MTAPMVSAPLISSTKIKISQYFCHYEVVRSTTAARNSIDNDVYDQEVFENAKALGVNVLDKIREQFGSFGPNSWYRGEELEKAICWGQNDNSSFGRWCRKYGLLTSDEESWATYFKRKQHPMGAAADIEIAGVSNDELFEWIRDNLEYDQLIREFPKPDQPMSGWVHVSWNRHGKNRMMAFTIG